MAKNNAQIIYGALKKAGYTQAYVHRMLPDWWDDELLENASAKVELDLMLSRMFGLNLLSLLKEVPEIAFEIPENTKYKRSKKLDPQDLAGATSLVQSVAKMVSKAVPHPFKGFSKTPKEIRNEILHNYANRVSLMGLISFLWEMGIPTIHLSDLPDGLKKMDGMCLKVNGRPIIILCKTSSFQAWHLFIVAHELAHVALGHIETDEILVDYVVGEESYLLSDEDPEEIAADNFALELLNGDAGIHYTSQRPANHAQLIDAAIRYQRENQVDAGHVILNYGHYNSAWPIAQAALKKIDLGHAPSTINQFLFDHLDFASLPRTSIEFLLKAAGFIEPISEGN